MTQHEKIELMYTKHASSYYSAYLVHFIKSVSCMRLPIDCCTSAENSVTVLCLVRQEVLYLNTEKVVKFYVYISPTFMFGQLLHATK